MMRMLVNNFAMPLKGEIGQTAIFVFVLLLVGMTIALSVAGRTLRDFKAAGSSDFSARAFAAAEAGAEEALRQDLSTVTTGTYTSNPAGFGSANKSTFKYKVDNLTIYNQTIAEDDTLQLDLTDPAQSNQYFHHTIALYWGKLTDTVSGGENSSGTRPSLEISYFVRSSNGNNNEYSFAKFTVNAETRSNNFANPVDLTTAFTHPVNGVNNATYSNLVPNYLSGQNDPNPAPNYSGVYSNVVYMNFAGSPDVQFVRIRPLYNRATLGVQAAPDVGDMRPVAYTVTSQGNSGDATRAVQVSKTQPSMPPVLDFALFNGSTAQVGK